MNMDRRGFMRGLMLGVAGAAIGGKPAAGLPIPDVTAEAPSVGMRSEEVEGELTLVNFDLRIETDMEVRLGRSAPAPIYTTMRGEAEFYITGNAPAPFFDALMSMTPVPLHFQMHGQICTGEAVFNEMNIGAAIDRGQYVSVGFYVNNFQMRSRKLFESNKGRLGDVPIDPFGRTR